MTAKDRQQLLRLAAEIAADLAYVDEIIARLGPWRAKTPSGDEVLIPAALLHHFYTAIETVLSRVVMALEGSVPGGADSHSHLLTVSALEITGTRPALITAESRESLRELLGFRHLFRHGYAAAYRVERLQELVALATHAWPTVKQSLEQARSHVLQCAAT